MSTITPDQKTELEKVRQEVVARLTEKGFKISAKGYYGESATHPDDLHRKCQFIIDHDCDNRFGCSRHLGYKISIWTGRRVTYKAKSSNDFDYKKIVERIVERADAEAAQAAATQVRLDEAKAREKQQEADGIPESYHGASFRLGPRGYRISFTMDDLKLKEAQDIYATLREIRRDSR